MRVLRFLVPGVLPFCSGFLQAEPLQFRDGDRIVLIGNTLVERAQTYGHWETALVLASGEKRIQLRNLGWSGDTVEGTARSYFGPPKEGFDRLAAQLQELCPTIVIFGYGAVAAQKGTEGLDSFLEQYRILLGMVTSKANPREIVLLSPPPAETLPAPLPDQSAYNQKLALYGSAIQKLAEERSHRFVDLYQPMVSPRDEPLTENGIHYSEEGYKALAKALIQGLGLSDPNPLPRHVERLRQTIVAKNRLFFHQWRPSNETYLRGFRQHEQGQNAKELDLFDPLLEAKELEIEVMKKVALTQIQNFPN